MTFSRLNRLIHHWATLIVAIPVMIMIGTGCLLLLKKDIDWIQPPTLRGAGKAPLISFEETLKIAKTVPEAGITSWADVDRLDVRPSKGMLKLRAENRWEIQIDTPAAIVLAVMWMTGLYLFALPHLAKARKARKGRHKPRAPAQKIS